MRTNVCVTKMYVALGLSVKTWEVHIYVIVRMDIIMMENLAKVNLSAFISRFTHTVMFLFHWKIRFTVFWTRCLSYLAIHVNTISAAIFCLESSVKAMHNPFNNIFHSSVLGYQLVNLRKSMKSKSFADCLVRHTLKNPIDFPLLMYYW